MTYHYKHFCRSNLRLTGLFCFALLAIDSAALKANGDPGVKQLFVAEDEKEKNKFFPLKEKMRPQEIKGTYLPEGKTASYKIQEFMKGLFHHITSYFK